MKRTMRILCLMLALCCVSSAALAQIDSYSALYDAIQNAQEDTLLYISGRISPGAGDLPLQGNVRITLKGAQGESAQLVALHIDSLDITFADVRLVQGLTVSGNSNVTLSKGTRVKGAPARSGVVMSGRGLLSIDSGATVTGGSHASGIAGDGVVISGGDISVVVEGTLRGGEGKTGGSALTISSLRGTSSVNVSGNLAGGYGESVGGSGVNIYDLESSSTVHLGGHISGGNSARAGGYATQIINIASGASIAVSGDVFGGDGLSYGGDTIMAMNVGGTLTLSGTLAGGSVPHTGIRPGSALLLLDSMTTGNTRLVAANLVDGQILPGEDTPAETALPEPSPQPAPEETQTPPTDTPSPEPTPEETPNVPATPDEVLPAEDADDADPLDT